MVSLSACLGCGSAAPKPVAQPSPRPDDDYSKAGSPHWRNYAGPKVKATALSTKQVWAVVPTSLRFDFVKIALREYGQADGYEQRVLDFLKGELWVPRIRHDSGKEETMSFARVTASP